MQSLLFINEFSATTIQKKQISKFSGLAQFSWFLFFFFCQIVCSKSQKKEKQSSLPSKCWKSENGGNLAIGISRKRWSKVIRRQLEERKVRKELAKDCYTWMLTNKNSCNSYMYGKQVLNRTRWQCIILLTFIIRINLISSLNYHCSAEVLLKRVFCLDKKRYNSF